jgi:hypothetical protein
VLHRFLLLISAIDQANRAAAMSLETRETAQPTAPVERLVGAFLTANRPTTKSRVTELCQNAMEIANRVLERSTAARRLHARYQPEPNPGSAIARNHGASAEDSPL